MYKDSLSYKRSPLAIVEVPVSAASAETTETSNDGTSKKKARTVTVTADDMQRRKNDVKARTTLLLSLPNEHQLRFKIEQDDLNQKFLTSLAPEWLMHTIVWRNKSDLNTMSLDDLYNHLKVYESKVQKKSEPNPQNMAFISSAKHSRGNEDVTTASVFTASTNVSTASTNVGVASISQDTACAYIASQSSGSQIKFEDINQIDEDDMEEMDIKWNMALLSMRADCYMANDEENHALVAEKEAPTEFALMAITSAESKRLDKNKEGLGYNVVPPPPAQLYSSPKKDLSWTGLPEFKDDTVTDYSRPAPTIESSPNDAQNINSSVTKEASPSTISPKSFIKFVKANVSPSKSKIDKAKKAKKSFVKYAELYRKPTQKPNVRGNQMNWNNLKSYQLGGCKITGKETIKTGKLEFENVYFVKDLKYNLFSVSQICDNKNSVLFTDSECIVLGQNFKLSDDDNVLLTTPRQHNMYSIDLNNIVPHKDLTCLVAKASADECILWHRRLGHLNFKTMNKLVRHNLVRGLPTKCFENDHTCTACLKGKQHKASCKSKLVNSVSKTLYTLYMDLFGPTSVSSISHKWYCLVVTDDFSRKGIKREFSNARTPKQNGVAERRNRTLIEAARTMLADAKLPVTFWAEAVNTACYVQNRVLVNNKPQDDCSADVPESSGISNLTATSTNPPADQLETLTVETPILTIIGPVDTPIQTRNKSKENVWTLVNCPKGVRPIRTKWVLKNKKDERGIVIKNKARLVAQGHTQEEGIEYDEVFAPVARIEAIRVFFAYASFMGFTVYQMDVKSELNFFLGLQVLQKEDGIFLSQDKYVGDILKKFGYSDVRSSNTPMDKENPWGKDRTRKDVDLHLYRSMIGSLIYLTASRLDIMFAVCACARHQVISKECHLHAVKMIFRYLKGHPKLGL
nr:putative ribonuclease H-like domain-containing protein [Tanacetum cinerariifolium]